MHPQASILAAVLSAVALASCSGPAHDCGSGWQRSDGPPINLRELQQVKFPQIETSLIAEVDRCYVPDRPGATLRFEEEWLDKVGNRYLVFGIRGTADVEFAAVVDQSGNIVRVGQTTHNW